ncbi:hypothetical protein ACWEMW_26200 [Streptomyces sp. NPDC004684]
MGAVLVDGALPYDWLDEAMEQRIRELFRRLSWFMPLLRPTGLAPRMTAEHQANSDIELGRLSHERELGPVLDDITAPMRYVVASGTSFGSRGDEQKRRRAGLDAVTARNPNIRIGAKAASNHGAVLKKDFQAIASAVHEVAALGRERPALRMRPRRPEHSSLGRPGCRRPCAGFELAAGPRCRGNPRKFFRMGL